jgi:outer membrane protein
MIASKSWKPRRQLAAGLFGALCAVAAAAEDHAAFPDHIVGDLGGMVYAAGTPIRGDSKSLLPLPYAYFDYQRFFTRLDTFGLKGCRMGYGHMEVVGRVNFDRIKTDTTALHGLTERKTSLPAGIGTYQLTPIGAFFAYAFHDFGESHGNLYELSYAAKLDLDRVVVYPRVGIDLRSAGWLGYYYGVSPTESAASGYGEYHPGRASTPYAVLMLETRLSGDWYGNLELRRDWLPQAVYASPLVKDKSRDSAFVAVAYRFK